MIGSHVGDYEVTGSLGKGGFGSVWKAESGTGVTVALKLLNPQALDNQRVVKKFFHEAMILAKLDHPNITKLLEFFPDGDNYAIVMEYVEGVELKRILQQQNGPLPFDQAYSIAHQALSAFQYANENGILHRDIKPGNIIIDTSGNAKIMDFGIAKMSSAASHDTAASMLSVHYVPPERFDKSREIDARSDIYSLGLVFYEMFAGKRPFDATETSQIMFSHLNEIPEMPVTHSPSLPRPISDSISKALEKDPEDRFPDFESFAQAMTLDTAAFDDATAILDDIDATLMDDTIDIGEDGSPGPDTIEAQVKSKTGLIIGIALVLIIIASAAGYFLMSGKTTSERPVTATSPKPKPPAISEPGTKNAKDFFEVTHPADGSTMVHIPAGEFTMGSDKYSAEKPPQTIQLSDYYIDKYLVTNAQFKKFVAETGYKTDAEKEGSGLVRLGRRWKKVEGANWGVPDGLSDVEGRDEFPVSQVSYNDASSYCQWANKSLPTEAQWEKAARGPEGAPFPWGNADPNDTMANFDNIVGSVTPVTQYEKGQSHYGVFDTAGNVYQWTKDWYGTGERKTTDPTGPDTGKERVIKGGSFIEGMDSLRSANRDRYEPSYSSFLFGFRCATPFPIEGLK
jgi:serine/threonine-protein kinase